MVVPLGQMPQVLVAASRQMGLGEEQHLFPQVVVPTPQVPQVLVAALVQMGLGSVQQAVPQLAPVMQAQLLPESQVYFVESQQNLAGTTLGQATELGSSVQSGTQPVGPQDLSASQQAPAAGHQV